MRLSNALLLLLLITLCASIATAGQVTLAWDANTEPVTGYRVFATPVIDAYDYEMPLYEGTATSCTVEINSNVELKFVARAYLVGEDGVEYESEDSNEVRHAVVVWENPNLRTQ